MDLDGDGVIFMYEHGVTIYYCSIEYWFRCMDLDGDGVIFMYEMEYYLLL